MLRRRAFQNRSNLLAIDSDDDEWHGTDGGFYQAGEEDEDSAVESFSDEDVLTGYGDDSSSESISRHKEDYGNAISVGDGDGDGECRDVTEMNSKRV